MHATPVESESRTRVRASLTPWYRGTTYAGAFALSAALWLLGTSGPTSMDWARTVAWVPTALVTFLILRWQRQALDARAQRKTDPGEDHTHPGSPLR